MAQVFTPAMSPTSIAWNRIAIKYSRFESLSIVSLSGLAGTTSVSISGLRVFKMPSNFLHKSKSILFWNEKISIFLSLNSITICSGEVEEALRESVYIIVHTAKSVLGQTPPELAADIIDKGIVITGGGALIDGFDLLLAHELKVPVFIAESPLTCVVEGTGVLLDNIHLIDK